MVYASMSKPQFKKTAPKMPGSKQQSVPSRQKVNTGTKVQADFQGLCLPIQAKLKVSEPNDRYEQEADRVADQVMRMPDSANSQPTLQQQTAEETEMVQTKPSAITIQRMCTECEEKEKLQRQMQDDEDEELLQTQRQSGRVPIVRPDIQAGIQHLLQSGGAALPTATRSFMEPRFGHDFTDVKIHTSPQAADLSQRANARAFTVGHDVFFNQGEFQPNTSTGKRLLAHELTHTLQQTSTSSTLRRVEVPTPINSSEKTEDSDPSSIPDKGTLRLKGCEGKEAKLNEILNLSQRIVDAGVACLELGDSLNFQQWFGQYTPARRQRILRRMKRLRHWLFNHPIKFICVSPEQVRESNVPGFPPCRTYVKDGQSGHTVAHTKGVVFTPVWLCPPFFEEPPLSQAATLVHEAAHAAFSALDQGESQKLGGGLNAYNFEGFTKQAFMGCSPATPSKTLTTDDMA